MHRRVNPKAVLCSMRHMCVPRLPFDDILRVIIHSHILIPVNKHSTLVTWWNAQRTSYGSLAHPLGSVSLLFDHC
jgi:hypothetical protein